MERPADPSIRLEPVIRTVTALIVLLMAAATVGLARLPRPSPRLTALTADWRPGAGPPQSVLHHLPPLPGESRAESSSTTSTPAPPARATTGRRTQGAPAAQAAPSAARTAAGYSCAAALSYLAAHAAPGFTFECPGNAMGRQAMTCQNVAGVCPGARIIAIADPCPAAYMNEAFNSWVAEGRASGSFDPYGYCRN